MYATTGTECPLELVKNHDVTLFIDHHCLSNIILKPKRSDYAMFRYGNPRSALYRVQRPLKHVIWCLRSSEHRVIVVDMTWYKTTGTPQHMLSCGFVWEFVWSGFCMGTIEGHSSRFCEWMSEKNPTLDSVSGVTFLDSTQQNLSLRLHSLGILQSTFYHLLISVVSWWTLSMFLCPWTSLPSK